MTLLSLEKVNEYPLLDLIIRDKWASIGRILVKVIRSADNCHLQMSQAFLAYHLWGESVIVDPMHCSPFQMVTGKFTASNSTCYHLKWPGILKNSTGTQVPYWFEKLFYVLS